MKHFSDGSIYCTPVTIQLPAPSPHDKYIITFTSYGRQFCDAWDKEATQAACMLFQQFTRRIELELTLLSMKKWIWDSKKANKKPQGRRRRRS